jgi:RND family efflux transporter MFP subunit
MKRAFLFLIPLLVLGVLIVWRLEQKKTENANMLQQRAARAKAPPNVVVAPAELRDIVRVHEATGTLEAPLNVKISPKVTGRIDFLEAHEGDRVSKGQVLVRIDASQVAAQVRQQQAAVTEAQYRLAQAQITQNPTNVSVSTNIRQQAAGVAAAQADYDQTRENLAAQLAAAQSAVTDAQGRVDNASAAIGTAKASIDAAQANLDNARTKLNRILDLYKQGFIAAQDVDDAKATVAVQQGGLAVAQSQLKAAQAQRDSTLAQKQAAEQQVKITKTKGDADIEAARQKLAQANAALDYAKANSAQIPAYEKSLAALKSGVTQAKAALQVAQAQRADTVLASPLDGYVTARYMDPGTTATPGQPILAIESFRQVWVAVAVPDEVSQKLRLGQDVQARFGALPGRVFTAKIVQINPSADPQAHQFTIRADLSNTEDLFRPGMFAKVTFETERASHVVAVPREAVEQDREGSYVIVVDNQKIAHRRTVTQGPSDPAFIAVSSVTAGEKVVTISRAPVKDGQEVSFGPKPGKAPAGGPPGQGPAPRQGTPPASPAPR